MINSIELVSIQIDGLYFRLYSDNTTEWKPKYKWSGGDLDKVNLLNDYLLELVFNENIDRVDTPNVFQDIADKTVKMFHGKIVFVEYQTPETVILDDVLLIEEGEDILEKGKHSKLIQVEGKHGRFYRHQLVNDDEITHEEKIHNIPIRPNYNINEETLKELEGYKVKISGGRLDLKTKAFNENYKGFDLLHYFSGIDDLMTKTHTDIKSKTHSVEFGVDNGVFKETTLRSEIRLKNGEKFVMIRTLGEENGNKTIHLDMVEVPKGLRGTSFTKDLLKFQDNLYKNVKVDRLEMTANMTSEKPVNGANVWQKYGFNCLKDETGDIINKFPETMKTQASEIVNDYFEKNPKAETFPLAMLYDKMDDKKVFEVMSDIEWHGVLDYRDAIQMERWNDKLYKL